MSNSARANKSAKATKKAEMSSIPSADKTSNIKTKFFFIAVIILAAIPFSLGKYMELNMPDPYDSGGYVYSAKHILEGAQLGVDEKPGARVGTLLLNMVGVKLFGFSETGPKLILAVLQVAALILMFFAMYKLFGALAASTGVIIASVYLSAPLVAKFGNVKEQYMIAFMVMGISCFVLGQRGGRWFWMVLAGAFVSYGPLFKETGTTALGAIGLFVIAQPFLKNRTFKQTASDIGLLVAGAVVGLLPVYIWLFAVKAPVGYYPYSFLWKIFFPPKGGQSFAYVSNARSLRSYSEQASRVFSFYLMLILPIAFAVSSIIMRLIRMALSGLGRIKKEQRKAYERFVLLFGVWWLLDMAFVWISPRSYDQYYLPLNASAAMLAGYIIAVYADKLKKTVYKGRWRAVGFAALLCMIVMSWHIFFGAKRSPHTGYVHPKKRYGYKQRLELISQLREGQAMPWQAAGKHIRDNSEPTDKIYVWGWYPGIYVAAQRFSASASSVTSEMHTTAPEQFARMIGDLLFSFEKQIPVFIVDTRKRHFPGNRPPLELWPIMPKEFTGLKNARPLPMDKKVIEKYDFWWSGILRQRFGEDEALRFEAMKPFRDFIMANYKIVPRPFGGQILLELKEPDKTK